jgi:phospholipid N-methyltransferase
MKSEGKARFFLNFLKDPLKNASITPTSKHASDLMLKGIDFSKVDTVIELGPGNGCVTSVILEKCRKDTKIILVELEKTYLPILRKRFGDRVIIENTCASKMPDIMKRNGVKNVELIISGLPFLPKGPREKVHKAIKKLSYEGAKFRYLTYMPYFMKKVYRDLPVEKKEFTWNNVPPLWVYGIN